MEQNDVYKKWTLKNYPDVIELAEYEKANEGIKFDIHYFPHDENYSFIKDSILSICSQSYINFNIYIYYLNDELKEYAYSMLVSYRNIKWIKLEKEPLDNLFILKKYVKNLHSYSLVLKGYDLLWPNILKRISSCIINNPEKELIYYDEDKVYGNQRYNHFDPLFKPDWDRQLFYSFNYINRSFCVKNELLHHFITKTEDLYFSNFIYFLIEEKKENKILHIDTVLYSWRINSLNESIVMNETNKHNMEKETFLLERHFKKMYNIEINVGYHHYYKNVKTIKYRNKLKKNVSIIIPTKNQYELIEKCISSIINNTFFEDDYEIVIVDTGSKSPKVIEFYKEIEYKYSFIRVVYYCNEIFNFSNACNFGASKALYDNLVFLNNDIEIVDSTWLTGILNYLEREDIGCVGVRLDYPGRLKIQHAGIAIGVNGVATNLLNGKRYKKNFTINQQYYLEFPREVLAVTGACLGIRKNLFEKVHGFNSDFRITFNDVDICLEVHERGYKNIYIANIILIHHESPSLGHLNETRREMDEFYESEEKFRRKWKKYIEHDPFFNKNFDHKVSLFMLENDY